jgi:hypothetical protein
MKTIKLMPDYGCNPLWWSGDDYGEVDFNEIPISEKMKLKLNEWASKYDKTFDKNNPQHSGFDTQAQIDDFLTEGENLFSQLKKELGENYNLEKNFTGIEIKTNEFVIKTKPGIIAPLDYGEKLHNTLEKYGFFEKLKIPTEVYEIDSAVPDVIDVFNLEDGFGSGEFAKREFSEFCKAHQFDDDIKSETSASHFLEFKRGRTIARLHVPVNDEYRIVSAFYQLTKGLNLVLLNLQTNEIVTI